MKVALYFINWNDSFYFPFLNAHYGAFCDKIVMYDNQSDDQSHKIAGEFGWEVREFGNGELNDYHYLEVKNHCWKECRSKGYDYVIVCDADEFIVPPKDTTHPFPNVTGYNMISETLPVSNIFEINTGEISKHFSKQAIFNPDKVLEINYLGGCHTNKAIVKQIHKFKTYSLPQHQAQLYHFRNIGGIDRKLARHKEYIKRFSAYNYAKGSGAEYLIADEKKCEDWNQCMQKAEVLF